MLYIKWSVYLSPQSRFLLIYDPVWSLFRFILCRSVYTLICLQHRHAWCLRRSEDIVRSPGTEAVDGYEPLCRWLGTEPRSSLRAASALNRLAISPASEVQS